MTPHFISSRIERYDWAGENNGEYTMDGLVDDIEIWVGSVTATYVITVNYSVIFPILE